MKRITLALVVLCALQSAVIAYLWSRDRLSAGPGSYTAFKTKRGEAIILQSSSPKLGLSYTDVGDESSFDATFKTSDGDLVLTGYFTDGRPSLNYLIHRSGTTVLLRKIDLDGIPTEKTVTSAGQIEHFGRKDIEWIPRTK